MLNIVNDKDLIWDVEDYDAILVGTSVYCMLTGGFQSKLRFKYPVIEEKNDKTPYGDLRKLGKRLTIDETTPIISLMYICTYPRKDKIFIDYDALKNCLLSANAEFSGKKVAATILGASRFDGNGEKDKCIEIIKECTPNLDITLYDYEQKSHREEVNEYRSRIYKMRKIDKQKYKQLVSQEKEELKKLYLA